MNSAPLIEVPLHNEHTQLGARMVPFAGFAMPVQYTSVIEEHHNVRNHAGLFDVSHMGLASVEGPDAQKFLDLLVTKDLTVSKNQQCIYALLCQENGGTVDDLIVYKKDPSFFYAVLNAGNKHKDLEHLKKQLTTFPYLQVEIKSHFDSHGILALQGPQALKILASCGIENIAAPFFWQETTLFGIPVILARTGYTGEEGCELFVPKEGLVKIWRGLLEKGNAFGIKPCGLGCRDTLRLEMGYSLYGHELTESINPIEAGLGWAVSLKSKKSFLGSLALAQSLASPERKLICLRNLGKQAPRQKMPVLSEGTVVGEITSGSFSPTLGHVIGMALVKNSSRPPYSVDIRGQHVPFELCQRPFIVKKSKL